MTVSFLPEQSTTVSSQSQSTGHWGLASHSPALSVLGSSDPTEKRKPNRVRISRASIVFVWCSYKIIKASYEQLAFGVLEVNVRKIKHSNFVNQNPSNLILHQMDNHFMNVKSTPCCMSRWMRVSCQTHVPYRIGAYVQQVWQMAAAELTEAEWRIYASVNNVIIGSDNGLSPARNNAINCTYVGLFLSGPLGINFREMLLKT